VENGIPVPERGIGAPLATGESASSSNQIGPVFDLSIPHSKNKNRQEKIYSRRGVVGAQQIVSSPSDWTVSTPSPRYLGEADHTAIGIDFVLT